MWLLQKVLGQENIANRSTRMIGPDLASASVSLSHGLMFAVASASVLASGWPESVCGKTKTRVGD